MPLVLEGAHPLQRDRPSDVDVRRGDVDPELHAQRPAERQFRRQTALGQHVDGVPRQVRDTHGATLSSALALLWKRNRAPKRRRIRKLRLLGLLCMLVLVGFSAFLFGLLTSVSTQISTLNPLDQKPLYQNTTIYANDGHTVLAVLHSSQARVVVPSADISPLIKQAIVAIEDKRFYDHRGVDIHGILRAFWNDVTGGPVQGGSTITQQFVKNAINGNAPTISRKLKEAALAWKLEQKWTKDEILTAYLNTIYFGNGAYGIQEACRVYFGHSAKHPG